MAKYSELITRFVDYELETLIYYVLRHTNKDERISLSKLSTIIGKSKTSIKKAIQRLRVSGAPIMSTTENPGGYWWGTTVEYESYIATQKRLLELNLSSLDEALTSYRESI